MTTRGTAKLTTWIGAMAVVFGTTMAAVSCSKCGENAEAQDAASAVLPPVPAPEGLLADIYVPAPNVVWQKVQRGIGGPVGILPSSAGGIVSMGLGLDPLVANEIDGAAPLFAVLAGDPSAPSWAIAFRLADARKARSVLADGEMARFSSREREGMTELVPKEGTTPPQAAIAITKSSYLVLGKSAADLERLVPYVTRTLTARPLPSTGAVIADVPRAAIATTIKPKLDGLWAAAKAYLLSADERMRAERGGRAPDFGDPKAIVEALDGYATKRLAVVGDLERMRIALDVTDDGIALQATMTPSGPTGPAATWTNAMKTGDLGPATDHAASSALVVATRDSEEDRAEQAQELEKALTKALGSRIGEADGKRLHDTIGEWTKARGEATTAALVWDEPQGLVLRTQARDVDASKSAMKGAVDLSRVSPFKEMLRVKDVTLSTDDVGGPEKASLAVFLREPPKVDPKDAKRRPPPPAPAAGDGGAPAPPKSEPKKDELSLAWVVQSGALSVATGSHALSTLRSSVKPEKKLSDDPAIARPLRALGSDASLLVLAQPLRFDPSRANLPTAPLVMALGRREKDAFVRLDVANGLLRELARWQLGL
ncbi:MAG: hypothetical protein JST00_13900 [Deltaproteobacteria bacterium]|nr:hypothetical protein [Deltaproteobacteria bacterium]